MLVIILLLATACSQGTSETSSNESSNNTSSNTTNEQAGKDQEASSSGDETVVVGIKAEVLTLDPAMYRDRTTEGVLRNIFDGLVTRTPDGEVKPQIAESWENPTPTEWIFKIREGVKFHDGSDLTVDDVVFTFERLITEGAIDGQTAPRKGLLGPLSKVEKVDDQHVKFILDEPWPILIKMLPHQQIVPKAYIEKVGNEEFAKNPIGAGPFKFVKGNLDERIELERFDDYYGGSPDIPPVGPAKIKKLIFEVIPENSSRIAALQSGEVHRIHAVPPVLVRELEKDENLEVKTAEGTRVYMIEMNVNKPPFDDPRVRQAMNYAVNMDLIVEQILEGYGTRLAGPLLSNAFGLDKDLKPYPYDPEKAKELLAEAGYADGFQVVIDTDDANREVAEAVASELRKIGIDANTRVWEWGVLQPLLINGERSMYMTDWGNSTQDPYDFLNPKLRTDDRGNYSQYSNARVDQLLNDASVETDLQKREQMYIEAQRIIYDEAPWIFGYSMQEIEAGVKGLKGWEPSSDGMMKMHDAYLEN